jgi:hypothetical protein
MPSSRSEEYGHQLIVRFRADTAHLRFFDPQSGNALV